MVPKWAAAAAAKTKATAIIAGSLIAGGVGGAVALGHVAPVAHVVTTAADATPTPTTNPESVDATPTADPEPTATATPTADPESSDAATPTPDPESSDAGGSYPLPPCPSDAPNHGKYVASVAHGAPKGKGGNHGGWVSQAAKSDCGKPAPDATASAEPTETADPEPTEKDSPDATGKVSGDHGHPSAAHGRSSAGAHPGSVGHGHSKG